MKLLNLIDSLYERYKTDEKFATFLKESGFYEGILSLLKKRAGVSKPAIKEQIKADSDEQHSDLISNSHDTNEISNSDGFSKIIFEDLKIKRALSEHIVSQEHLLSQNDIRESFSYLAKNFNNVQLHQGEIWVIEYMGGL